MRKTCTIVKRSADSQTPPALESNDHFTVVQAEGARDSARNGGGSSPTYRASLLRARCRPSTGFCGRSGAHDTGQRAAMAAPAARAKPCVAESFRGRRLRLNQARGEKAGGSYDRHSTVPHRALVQKPDVTGSKQASKHRPAVLDPTAGRRRESWADAASSRWPVSTFAVARQRQQEQHGRVAVFVQDACLPGGTDCRRAVYPSSRRGGTDTGPSRAVVPYVPSYLQSSSPGAARRGPVADVRARRTRAWLAVVRPGDAAKGPLAVAAAGRDLEKDDDDGKLGPGLGRGGRPHLELSLFAFTFQAPPDMRFPNIRQGGGHGTWASIPPGTHRAASPGAFLWGRPHQPPTPPQPLSHAAAKAMACDALGGWMETLAFAFVSLLPSGQSTRRGISADDAHMSSSPFHMDPLEVPTGSRLGFWPSCLPAQPRRRWKGPWTQRSASHLPLHVCVAPAVRLLCRLPVVLADCPMRFKSGPRRCSNSTGAPVILLNDAYMQAPCFVIGKKITAERERTLCDARRRRNLRPRLEVEGVAAIVVVGLSPDGAGGNAHHLMPRGVMHGRGWESAIGARGMPAWLGFRCGAGCWWQQGGAVRVWCSVRWVGFMLKAATAQQAHPSCPRGVAQRREEEWAPSLSVPLLCLCRSLPLAPRDPLGCSLVWSTARLAVKNMVPCSQATAA
ncbi:hypothetical protein Purlil1_3659 [Purpureocillium lilacinum]|uniref:Uncharacterized protein n=1 Tax=Purpureocillium lilacinum TaxID=33203 RepID=A0ABR0C6H5_PURLI|nr:hypothetical protein Purlil1_3659 [Purpureocillium lilacinum]